MRKILHLNLSCLKDFASDCLRYHWRRLESFGSLERTTDYKATFQTYKFTPAEGVQMYSVWKGKPKDEKDTRYYLLIKQGIPRWIHLYGGLNDYLDVLGEDSLNLPTSLAQDSAVRALIQEAAENADEQEVLEQLAGTSEEEDIDFPDEDIGDEY